MKTVNVDLSDTLYGALVVELSVTCAGRVRGGTVFVEGEPLGVFCVTDTALKAIGYGVPAVEGTVLVDGIRSALTEHARTTKQ